MGNQTPETIRTAAYLAARERLDARKTTRNVQCNPPNIRCGNRCIPPTWDCRLKGQGTDPHLRAVKTDPLGGLANIQRGFGRISRGVVRGNFSEVEGGKRAIIRGAVKVAPGNIQQKKELQKKLEDRTRAIGIGLAVVTGGLGIHAILMKNNTFGYRNGLGADINSATRAGISRVLDSLPLVGAQRARTRESVSGAVGAATARFATEAVSGPDVMRATLGTGGEAMLSRAPLRDNAGQLVVDTNRVDRESSSDNFYTWNQKHREAFWTSSINESGVGADRNSKFSVFARPTAEEHLARQFNLTGDEALTTRSIKDAITARVETERGDLIALAKQQGFRVSRSGGRESINEADLGTFMRGVVRSSGGSAGYSPAIRRELEGHIEGVLTRSPAAYANTIYGRTVRGFNDFYKEVGDIARNTAGASTLDPSLRQRGYGEILGSADLTRARYLSGRMGLTRPVAGDAHAELIRTAYFATRVAGTRSSTYSITDRLALSAASELAGRPITTTADAMRLLQSDYGFTGAVRVRSPREATPRAAAPSTTGQPRPARRRVRSRSELIRTLTQGGLSPEAAAAEADRIIASRGDEADCSPELVRTATYLAARADFQEGKRLGKPCGASHIPKAHECRKGQGAPTPESDQKRKAAIIAAVAGGAVALAVAGSVAYNLKTLSDPTKSPLAPSPGIKDLVKSMKQEAGTKSASEAMGYYYTQKSGLKPGDVVYFRNEKDPAAHFGIYLGEGKDGKVRAVIANTNKSRFSWTDVAEIGATKPGLKTSQALMTPLVKAPDPKFKATTGTPLTNEEVVKRAIRIAGTDYKFSLTKDNCEALANGIAYGVPESEQLQRFRRATRAVVDVGVSRGQRREGREAIYQGRAQGRGYTATEFVTFLQGQREFSSPAGKDLARQYAQYFEGSRLDAERAAGGLISPDELWSRIKTYGPAVRAQAMADYLLIQRSQVEMDRGRR
jgi:hypothetical protein